MARFLKTDYKTTVKLRLWCGTCEANTFHQVVKTALLEYDDEEDFPVYSSEEFQIVRCSGCEDLSFRYAAERPGQQTIEKLSPDRFAGRRELADAMWHLPDYIYSLYEETFHSMAIGQRVISAMGVRALVEAVCKDQCAKGDNLKARIEALVEMGHLSQRDSKHLQDLRLMGNQATHEIEAHDEKQLKSALEIVEHLLKTIYILPQTAEGLKKK